MCYCQILLATTFCLRMFSQSSFTLSYQCLFAQQRFSENSSANNLKLARSKGAIKMDPAETEQPVRSEEATLSKALKGIRDGVNDPDVDVHVVVEEYHKFATIYDKMRVNSRGIKLGTGHRPICGLQHCNPIHWICKTLTVCAGFHCPHSKKHLLRKKCSVIYVIHWRACSPNSSEATAAEAANQKKAMTT